MAILVFAEHAGDHFKKAAYEATTYGADLAQALGTECIALVLGAAIAPKAAELGKYGATKVLTVADPELDTLREGAYAAAIHAAASQVGATICVVSQTTQGRALGGRLAIKREAALISGATSLLQAAGAGYSATKVAYTGKVVETLTTTGTNVVVSVKMNGYKLVERNATATVTPFAFTPEAKHLVAKLTERIMASGDLPLTEADVVVSAGRGVGNEQTFTQNWAHIGALAKELGAATACSKPIGDLHWRPHHEHVGQTGVQIAPNVYIAVGISGAIQHLAGVSASKTIIVINKDPEAPFFKAADYGIVGDAMDVVPRLVDAVRKHKAK